MFGGVWKSKVIIFRDVCKLHKIQISVSIKSWWNTAVLTHFCVIRGGVWATTTPVVATETARSARPERCTAGPHGACPVSSDVRAELGSEPTEQPGRKRGALLTAAWDQVTPLAQSRDLQVWGADVSSGSHSSGALPPHRPPPTARPQARLPKAPTPANFPWLLGPRALHPAGPAVSVLSIRGRPRGWRGREERNQSG